MTEPRAVQVPTARPGVGACVRRAVVLVGPDIAMHGGISRVMSVLSKSALARRYDLRILATSRQGGPISKAITAARALVEAYRLAGERPLFHIGVASDVSFRRKAAVAWLVMVRGCPVVIHLYGGGFADYASGGTFVRKWAIRRVFSKADRVLVQSTSWEREVSRFSGRGDAVSVGNPVRIPESASLTTGSRVIFTGVLEPEKGVTDLIGAVALLQQAGVEFDCTLTGDDRSGHVEALISGLPNPERVQAVGWVSRERLEELLAESSVFCLPSHVEGLPMALLEAMAHGLACVATPVGGIPDVLRDGENGVLVPVGDPPALAEALRELLRDPELRHRLGSAAREDMRSGFAVEAVVGRITAVYESLGFKACPSEPTVENLNTT